MTLQAVVQAKLGSGENAIAVHEASLLHGWVPAARWLALVECAGSHALVVLGPGGPHNDPTVDRVLPVDQHFRCEIDPDNTHQDGQDVYVNVSSQKLKLLFEMVPGVKTSNFVGEIFRAIEVFGKRRRPPDVDWPQKYPGVVDCIEDGDIGIGCSPGEQQPDSFQFVQSIEDNCAHGDLYGGLVGIDKHAEKQLRNTTEQTENTSLLVLGDLESPELAVSRHNIARGAAPIAARESVIRYQMAMKEHHYTYTQVLRIYVGTWNVNGQPPTVELGEWLACDEEPPDVYAIGFQELDLSKEAFLFNDTPREEEWQKAVMNALHPKARFRKVALVRLVGMMLLVFVQEQHAAYVSRVAVETVGTGIMGKMGNKGGVAVRMDLHTTSVCFVNSHLAAHVEEFERRNQDYHDICSRMTFTKFHPAKGIADHDHVYWLGDLNYRIVDRDPREVKEMLEQGELAAIVPYDQLYRQCQLKSVFADYHEGELTFCPTYKYDPGTDNWDSSEKNRAPAWCDRILWHGDGIQQVAYRSHPQLRISDHKPVSSLFDSQVRVMDPVKYRRVHEEVMKKLDKLENEFLPQVMVDNTEIIFDTVHFLEAQTRELIIANTGQVPVSFEFIKKLDDSSYCKDWLNITPYAGFIKPGEKCDVKLDVYVDKTSACKLNSGEDKLYDILVLHLEGGKDIFITVTGTYQRSCFGSSIEALVYVSVPVREIPVGRLMELEHSPSGGTQDPYPIPKEVWFLVDHLYRHGLKQPHLFEQPGLNSELLLIRNWLDRGSPDPMPGSVHSVAEALLMLLESTSEPLVPYSLHNNCLDACSNYLQCKQIVMQLPEFRKNVFLYLCAFLQEVLSHTAENGSDTKTVATLFGTIFLRDAPRNHSDQNLRARANQQAIVKKKANFVYHFLVNDQSDLILGR